jgi:Asp-tRNA(Asn)/Glu-tRNA(Gln) amidotransferase A subunit family amidase
MTGVSPSAGWLPDGRTGPPEAATAVTGPAAKAAVQTGKTNMRQLLTGVTNSQKPYVQNPL